VWATLIGNSIISVAHTDNNTDPWYSSAACHSQKH